MPHSRLLLQLVAVLAAAPALRAADIPAIFAEVDRVAAKPLWPGFDIAKIPVEVYDGKQTWLRGHPSPPPEFKAGSSDNKLRVYEGLHASVRANTSTDLAGVRTATVMLDRSPDITPRQAAALIAHECFHVFEHERYPQWQANEAVLFTYPVENENAATLALLELEALRRAVAEADRCQAGQFAAIRQERFAAVGPDAAQYERSTELNEGAAQYIQNAVAGVKPDLSKDFGPTDVRNRAYAVGPAIAGLLDRLSPDWKTRVKGSLEELIPGAPLESCKFTAAEREAAAAKAARQIQAVVARRADLEKSFDADPGWKVVIEVAGGHLLTPAGFDPMNVERLGGAKVLHARWLKLQNNTGSAEAINHRSVTTGAGKHPLFNGVRFWTVLLGEKPDAKSDADVVRITAKGFDLQFSNAELETDTRLLTVRLR